MSEIHRDEIIYEEGWRESSPPAEVEKIPVDEALPDIAEKKPGSRPLLITIQLVLCLLLALILFVLKSMDSEAYHSFIDHYHDELQKPVVSQGVFDALDVTRLFESPEVSSTPDEASNS